MRAIRPTLLAPGWKYAWQGELNTVRVSRFARQLYRFSPWDTRQAFLKTRGTSDQNAGRKPAPGVPREAVNAFRGLVPPSPLPLRPFREITVEYCNGVRPTESPLGDILRSLGFMRDMNQTLRIDIFT